MFEQVNSEPVRKDYLGAETDAKVLFRDGRSIFGIILDHLTGESQLENLKFVPLNDLERYRATESSQFVITLDQRSVMAVDVCLK